MSTGGQTGERWRVLYRVPNRLGVRAITKLFDTQVEAQSVLDDLVSVGFKAVGVRRWPVPVEQKRGGVKHGD
jgi:hypothetical protein